MGGTRGVSVEKADLTPEVKPRPLPVIKNFFVRPVYTIK